MRFAGDAVALVVAESAVAAQDAAELVSVEYRELPAVITAEEAVAPGAPLVHQTVPGNIVLDFESGDEALTQNSIQECGPGSEVERPQLARGRQSDGAARLPRRVPA